MVSAAIPKQSYMVNMPDTDETFSLTDLIADHMTRHAQSEAQFCQAIGIRTPQAVCAFFDRLAVNDMIHMKHHRRQLAAALDLPIRTIDAAIHRTADRRAAEREAAWRTAFVPHAVLVTQNRRPSQLVIAALAGAEGKMSIELPPSLPKLSWPKHVVQLLPKGVPGFGFVTGFVINYSPDQAVRFDLDGKPLAALPAAYRPVEFRLSRQAQELRKMLDD